MPSFTDTELQKKFCEGFTFFPFRSLEQHGTLIYKRYAGKDNLKDVLEWHSKEHDAGHYTIKITKKLKHNDIPAAIELMQLLKEAGEWWETRLPVAKRHPLGKNLSMCLDKYCSLLTTYHKKVLQTIAAKLADKYRSIGIEGIAQMEDMVQQFMRETDTLHASLKDYSGGKQGFSRQMLNDEDREYLSKITAAIDAFKALQERTMYLLDAWKTRQVIYNSCRAMN